MRRLQAAVVILLVPSVVISAWAQSLLHWTFDGGPDGWRVVFGPGQIRTTIAREHIRVGTGALECSYEIAPRTYFAVTKAVSIPDQPHITLSFWMKSMKTTHLGVFLTERDGSGYGYLLAVPVGQWKQVAINSKQFTLDRSNPTNKDENGRLDVGQIAYITVADLTGLSAGQRSPASFYLDDFKVGGPK